MGLDTSADDYLLTSVLSAVYFAGVRQRYAEDFQPAYAVAVDDAVAQRNAQWFADESLFQNYLRPMIAFLEAFVFAMTPFLVLLFGLGAFGIHVIGAFLLTLVWINSWMPVLAVINLFQHLIASGKLAGLLAAALLAITFHVGLAKRLGVESQRATDLRDAMTQRVSLVP